MALGALGAWIACRRAGVPLGPVAGAVAPALAFGLAVAAWATGGRSTLRAAVDVLVGGGDRAEHRVAGYENYATFQPAFLYQSLWDVAVGFGVSGRPGGSR